MSERTTTTLRPIDADSERPDRFGPPTSRAQARRRQATASVLGIAAVATLTLGGHRLLAGGEGEPATPVDAPRTIIFGGNDGNDGTIDNGIEAARAFYGTPNGEGGYDYPDDVSDRDIQDLGGRIHEALTEGDSSHSIFVGDRVDLQRMSDGSVEISGVFDTTD